MTARKGLYFLLGFTVVGVVPIFIWQGDGRMVFVWMGSVLVGVLFWLYSYMLWYFSVYIVTNERLRQVSQKGLFKKTVVDLGLDKIISISYEVPGLFGGMLGYGTLLVQTMVGDLTISNVSHPESVYNRLQNVVDKANNRGK